MEDPEISTATDGEVVVMLAADSDPVAIDRAVRVAEQSRARLTIAILISEASAWTYLSPFSIDWLNAELEEEAERSARQALRRVPPDLPVTLRLFRRVGRSR
ncbi:MAG: hypothetical protein JSU06_13120 [Actinobacteria bacterium]|nr:hypothetical protein [Actinomycetota bacterium]